MQASTLRFDLGTPARFIVVAMEKSGALVCLERMISRKTELREYETFQLFDTEESEVVGICFCDREMAKSMAFALNTFHARH